MMFFTLTPTFIVIPPLIWIIFFSIESTFKFTRTNTLLDNSLRVLQLSADLSDLKANG